VEAGNGAEDVERQVGGAAPAAGNHESLKQLDRSRRRDGHQGGEGPATLALGDDESEGNEKNEVDDDIGEIQACVEPGRCAADWKQRRQSNEAENGQRPPIPLQKALRREVGWSGF
jgi:hypothetical protein